MHFICHIERKCNSLLHIYPDLKNVSPNFLLFSFTRDEAIETSNGKAQTQKND